MGGVINPSYIPIYLFSAIQKGVKVHPNLLTADGAHLVNVSEILREISLTEPLSLV